VRTPSPAERTPRQAEVHQMPRWVKALVIGAAVAVVLAVAVLVIGSGDHGPSRHLPGGDQNTTQTSDGHTPPVEHG